MSLGVYGLIEQGRPAWAEACKHGTEGQGLTLCGLTANLQHYLSFHSVFILYAFLLFATRIAACSY